MTDIWVAAENHACTYYAVFEADDEVGWFYLGLMRDNDAGELFGAIQIVRGRPDFSTADVSIIWNDRGNRAELLIRGQIFGYFDLVEMRGVPGRYPDRPLERSLQ